MDGPNGRRRQAGGQDGQARVLFVHSVRGPWGHVHMEGSYVELRTRYLCTACIESSQLAQSGHHDVDGCRRPSCYACRTCEFYSFDKLFC